MKKRFLLTTMLLAAVLLAFGLGAAADGPRWNIGDAPIGTGFSFFHNDGFPRVVDDADLFSTSEEAQLEERSAQIRSQYETDLVILTTKDLHGKNIMDVADDYFDYNGYGCGDDYDGIILVISMEPGDRQYWISTCGTEIALFKDEIEDMKSILVSYLSAGEYFGAGEAFLEYVAGVHKKDDFKRTHDYSAPRVVDEAELFDSALETKLEERISTLRDRYDMDLLILTVDASRVSGSVYQYAYDYGYFRGYGFGSGFDLLTLVIGKYDSGRTAVSAFYSGGGMSAMAYDASEFTERLQGSSPSAAANRFLTLAKCRLQFGHFPLKPGQIIVIALIALFIAWIVVGSMKRRHNAVRTAGQAADYIIPGSFRVLERNDYFVNSYVTKTRRPEPSRSTGGGGGGFHSGSSGHSHGGGGGHF